jgi:UDPglucose 6-dehydrogenase
MTAPARAAVAGLWHLGCVTAACLAEAGYDVVGLDGDTQVVGDLQEGRPPILEPGLTELIAAAVAQGTLRFTSDVRDVTNVDLVWIAYDTPVDDDDNADSDWVLERAREWLRHAAEGAKVVVSSQLPVGSVAKLASRLRVDGRDDLRFACVPENLRLGQALASFRSPERIVAGVADPSDRTWLAPVLERFSDRIEWMGVQSAEMTKHALNAFLATSVAFINEIATTCERVGADAAEVARGLKSDVRIGPRAYLGPGDAFSGGTLARDVSTLNRLARERGLPGYLMAGVAASNAAHREWARRAVLTVFNAGDSAEPARSLNGRQFAVWGLTYKPNTDTLRRSSALELCRWLSNHGASVRAHDPAVRELSGAQDAEIVLCDTPLAAIDAADALFLCTPWPAYLEIAPGDLVATMRTPMVFDAAGFLERHLQSEPSIAYTRVGTRPVE